MSDTKPDGVNHIVVDAPSMAVAREALEYRVGPPCNWETFYGTTSYRLVLWGEHLTESHLRQLSTACHELEMEYKDMAMYEDAREADRMEGAFLRGDESHLQAETDQ